MTSNSLRLTKLKNLKRIQFKITPGIGAQRPEKLDASTIKKIPHPPQTILENPTFQEHARKQMKRTQKTIERIKKERENVNVFPDVQDIPDRDH